MKIISKITPPVDEDDCSILLEFRTQGEAEEALEKLKVWKRLKDKGFVFGGWEHTPLNEYNLHIKAYTDKLVDYKDDLHLLFGGRR